MRTLRPFLIPRNTRSARVSPLLFVTVVLTHDAAIHHRKLAIQMQPVTIGRFETDIANLN
jgi:hypothetical protein